MSEEIIIRKFQPRDRDGVREIAWDTAFLGEPANIFFSGKEILADFLTLYFTDYEPESCFVVESNSGVAGYLIGSRDSRALVRIFRDKILFRLLAKFIVSKEFFRPQNLRMIFRFGSSFIKGEFRGQEFGADYPATLHINLRKDYRGRGIGQRLLSVFESYLKDRGVRGVHLATMSSFGERFFMDQGFSILSISRRSYFRHICGQDISVRVMGKKLPERGR